ncbi:hypothetical protein A5806_002615 [Enterococcus faecium]|uniref:hypothetical protein n=1 Tax=Enterococcus faecium TaxID=1352 RepID=UPI000B3E7FB7|nr:hypothetical protein [Enterococcus faecium]OUZ28006.1 hypothetical protein A5806_002615 [Enterococcus faecium]
MKKLVTIGATAMMGFVSLGGLQGITQATENHQGSVVGMVNTFAEDILGTSVYADEGIHFANNSLRLKLGSNSHYIYVDEEGKLSFNYPEDVKGAMIEGYLLKGDGTRVEKENLDKTKLDVNDRLIFCLNVEAVNAPLETTVYEGIQEFKSNEYYEIFFGENGRVTGKAINNSSTAKADVVFEHTEKSPEEPGWYGVVPSAITFTDSNKEQALDATVKIVNADDQKTDYTGPKSVIIKVKSTNGFELRDGKKAAVEYSLTKKIAML